MYYCVKSNKLNQSNLILLGHEEGTSWKHLQVDGFAKVYQFQQEALLKELLHTLILLQHSSVVPADAVSKVITIQISCVNK